MTKTTSAIKAFVGACDIAPLVSQNVDSALEAFLGNDLARDLLVALIESPAFSKELGEDFASENAVKGISACRSLRSCLNLSISLFFQTLSELLLPFDAKIGKACGDFAVTVNQSEMGQVKILDYLKKIDSTSFYEDLAERLVKENPHAIYPTSNYRESRGFVEATDSDRHVEAVMSSHTFTSVRLVDNVLDPEETTLRDMYGPLGRCICLVDHNVERFYGEQLEHYFETHGIKLDKLVYRAMEVDKGIHTVERMLGDFKRLGVSRNEPVLIAGGGVLTDTGGLACSLYHRNTPYVMLSTSIVSGIDAGPSPRTCCDGFGYKNLFGAYHPPVLSLTDRFFFTTLHEGWLRHGIAEIIKMATVKDRELFENLEKAGPDLIRTRFGTTDCEVGSDIDKLSQRILGGALRSYVAAEYDNLYETHQCRPHAFGHTWSPGFEIEAGLLHGHAVAIGMGFGAFLSFKEGWISDESFHRILGLISSFGLSLWSDILDNKDTLWAAQIKIVEKRGRNLVAPLPKGEIGECGYLNVMTQDDLYAAVEEYRSVCEEYPRKGVGIDPLCSDVGLEDPSTIAHHVPTTAGALAEEAAEAEKMLTAG
ncbi:MAG: sedoheptulose 7-phosphate cyclase [Cyanobacteria bacterium P01_C01_bin.89]